MSSEMTETAVSPDELAAMRRELTRLSARVEELEKAAGLARAQPAAPPPSPAPAPPGRAPLAEPAPPHEGLDEELVLIIAAAVAAFLGKKPHIRQIRLLGSAAWSQQGRVTIQASHALSHHKT
jgi:methylmalonyl-CoA carboxyltransferase large subunit